MNDLPMKVEVQVKIQDSVLGEVVFLATSSAQQTDAPNDRFGGVLYSYNDQIVRVLAPGNCAANCNGGVVYLGEYS